MRSLILLSVFLVLVLSAHTGIACRKPGEGSDHSSPKTLDAGGPGPSPSVKFCGKTFTPDVKSIYCRNRKVSDLTPLKGLTSLRYLSLKRTAVTNLGPLKGLNGLRLLSLAQMGVTDLSPLRSLTMLSTLKLKATAVSDLTPLAGLSKLNQLELDSTKVTNLAALKGLTALATLSLRNTGVSDLSPLNGLKRLGLLDVRGTRVTDAAVAKLKKQIPGLRIKWDPGFLPGPVGSTVGRIVLPWVTLWNFSCTYDRKTSLLSPETTPNFAYLLVAHAVHDLKPCASAGAVMEVHFHKPTGKPAVVKVVRSSHPGRTVCAAGVLKRRIQKSLITQDGVKACRFVLGFGVGSGIRNTKDKLIGKPPTPLQFNPIPAPRKARLKPWFLTFVNAARKQNYRGLRDPFWRLPAPQPLKPGKTAHRPPPPNSGNFARQLNELKKQLAKTLGPSKVEQLALYLAYVLRPEQQLGTKTGPNGGPSEKDLMREIGWNVYYSPKRLWLKRVTFAAGTLTVRGGCFGFKNLTETVKRLHDGPLFKNLRITDIDAGRSRAPILFELKALIGAPGWL